MKNKKSNGLDIKEKYGVLPHQFVDYLAIVGDSADNIKGVEGVGPKGASKLLQEYGTLENIYSHVGEIKGAIQKKLIDSKEMAFKAKVLAKIDTNASIQFDLSETIYDGPNKEELRKIFRELEFRELEGTMLGNEVQIVNGVAIGVRS
jgi:DNA polymerase-1